MPRVGNWNSGPARQTWSIGSGPDGSGGCHRDTHSKSPSGNYDDVLQSSRGRWAESRQGTETRVLHRRSAGASGTSGTSGTLTPTFVGRATSAERKATLFLSHPLAEGVASAHFPTRSFSCPTYSCPFSGIWEWKWDNDSRRPEAWSSAGVVTSLAFGQHVGLYRADHVR